MPEYQRKLPHKITHARHTLFRRFAAPGEDQAEDLYYYRLDEKDRFLRFKESAFRLNRKFDTAMSDEDALGGILRSLPEGQSLFRLGWFTSFEDLAYWVGYWRMADEPLVISRIKKEALHAIPGLKTCPDPMIKDGAAVLCYTIEPTTADNEQRSSLQIPFERTEFLVAEFEWRSGAPTLVELEPEPVPIEKEELPWVLVFGGLSDVASKVENLRIDRQRSAYEFAAMAKGALKAAGICCGSTDVWDLFDALVWAAGSWRHTPDPTRLSSDLLFATMYERRRFHRPWPEGEAELVRREGLSGIHALAWRLRDKGVLPMPSSDSFFGALAS